MRVLLHPNIQSLVTLCSKEGESRISSTVSLIVKHDDGAYRVDATNGRVLGIMQGPNDLSKVDEGIVHDPDTDQVLVKAEDWKAIFKTGNAKDGVLIVSGESTGEADAKQTELQLIRGTTVQKAWSFAGRPFPSDHVLPKRPPISTIHVNPDILIQVLNVAKKMLNEEINRVVINTYAGSGPGTAGLIGVSAVNHVTGQVFDAVLVPLELPKKEPEAFKPPVKEEVKPEGWDTVPGGTNEAPPVPEPVVVDVPAVPMDPADLNVLPSVQDAPVAGAGESKLAKQAQTNGKPKSKKTKKST